MIYKRFFVEYYKDLGNTVVLIGHRRSKDYKAQIGRSLLFAFSSPDDLKSIREMTLKPYKTLDLTTEVEDL